MSQWWRRLRDRVTGRAVDPELAQAIVQWARASTAMNKLVGSGSVISTDERSVVLVALQALRDLPSSGASVDTELLSAAEDLASRLLGDELAIVVQREVDREAI